MKSVILIGNGLNRTLGVKSWKEIIDMISFKTSFRTDDSFLNVLSFDCQQIEALKRKQPINLIDLVLKETKVKRNKIVKSGLYKQFTDLNFDVFLTTNYGYEIEYALGFDDNTDVLKNMCTDNRETKRSFKRANIINDKKVYHIHGEERFPDTVCIGMQHYIDNIMQIKGKINTIYQMNNKNNFSDELKQALKGSWVEHIFFSNLYIVGFGLDKSEIDIWWLLAYRASLIAQNLIDKNTIRYYCPDEDAKALYSYLHSLQIEVDPIYVVNNDWKNSYSNIAKMIIV
ncbi:MAG: hypothetical protein IJG49_04170 [Erysipelotrichaceae bacterium]|nr:hypothetical protein [Erysipelotrichaceae bacterium]